MLYIGLIVILIALYLIYDKQQDKKKLEEMKKRIAEQREEYYRKEKAERERIHAEKIAQMRKKEEEQKKKSEESANSSIAKSSVLQDTKSKKDADSLSYTKYYKKESDYLCNIIRAEKGYDDNHLYLRFITGSRHKIEISSEKIGQTIKLSSDTILNRWTLNKLIDEEEYINDIRKLVAVMAYVSVAKRDIVYPLGQLLHEHIQKFGRILSDDLMTFIAEFIIVLSAFAESESGEKLNESGKLNLMNMINIYVSREFGQFLCK